MSSVDFYEVKAPRWELVLCRHVETAYEAGERVYVRCSSEALARHVDELLWTFREDSFVPHGLWPGAGELKDPVAVGWHPGNPNRASRLVLAGAGEPDELSRYERATDFVPVADAALTGAARARYRAFRGRGHEVAFHSEPP